jgi:hypothetical protein
VPDLPDLPDLSGTVEIDGMYAGGNVKPANKKTERLRAVFPCARNRRSRGLKPEKMRESLPWSGLPVFR